MYGRTVCVCVAISTCICICICSIYENLDIHVYIGGHTGFASSTVVLHVASSPGKRRMQCRLAD